MYKYPNPLYSEYCSNEMGSLLIRSIFVCFLFIEFIHFAQISEGRKGFKRLIVNGHMYGVQNQCRNDRTVWKCTKRSCDPLNPGRCTGSATTKLINGYCMARIEKMHRCPQKLPKVKNFL